MKQLASAATSLALLAGLSGCGGADRGRPEQGPVEHSFADPGPTSTDCGADARLALTSISDFELGAAQGFWASKDRTEETFISPDPTQTPLPAEELGATRCGGRFAFHLQGGPFTDWGAAFGYSTHAAFDASQYRGLSFWARSGPGGQTELELGVADRHTDAEAVRQAIEAGEDVTPGVDVCRPLPELGPNDPPLEDEQRTLQERRLDCGDGFKKLVQLTSEWQFFAVPFSEMRQGGWRFVAPSFDTSAIWSFSFVQSRGYIDLWIDDVAWYE
jgi:hypothetical protein